MSVHQDTEVDLDLVALNERATLGAVMKSKPALDSVSVLVTREDFYQPAHALIWDAITDLSRSDHAGDAPVIDPMLVAGRMQELGTLGQVGGVPYLLELYTGAQTTSNAAWYARKVKSAANDRRLAETGARLMQGGASAMSVEDRQALIAQSMDELQTVAAGGSGEEPAAMVGDEFTELLEILENGGMGQGMSTGLHDLDDLLVGMLPGQLITIGARPGAGKTVAALSLAAHVASKQGRTALMFSLEMSRQEILGRLLAMTCRVNSRHLNLAKPRLTDEDWQRLATGMREVMEMPLLVSDDTDMTPSKINALIGAYKRKHPDLGLVVIDYVQLLSGDGRFDSRQAEMSYVSRELKKAAKRHNVAIVLAAQLNRKVEDRTDKKPQSSDLRDTGALEQDSDVVIMLHREDMYEPESVRAGEMDMIVTKNRNGGTGTAVAIAQMHYYRLSSMARVEEGH